MSGLFVYYDPDYDPECTAKFISSAVSEQVVKFLQGRGFEVVAAHGLRDTMLSVVTRERRRVVVVFAQDVAPDTVVDDPSATALIRQYLDNGGSIVWIGDIPFFYQAKEGGTGRDDEWWKTGAAGSILGVNPIFPGQTPIANISRLGKRRRLTAAWTGIRPILKDRSVVRLAGTKCQIGRAHVPLPSNWFSRQWRKLLGFQLGAQGLTLGVQLKDQLLGEEATIVWNKKLANAWSKNFDSSSPNSGFIRIWDYRSSVLSAMQLEDLNNIATSAVE